MKCCCEVPDGIPEVCECKKEILALTDAYHLLSDIYQAAARLMKISLESEAKTELKEACMEFEKWRGGSSRGFKFRHLRK